MQIDRQVHRQLQAGLVIRVWEVALRQITHTIVIILVGRQQRQIIAIILMLAKSASTEIGVNL